MPDTYLCIFLYKIGRTALNLPKKVNPSTFHVLILPVLADLQPLGYLLVTVVKRRIYFLKFNLAAMGLCCGNTSLQLRYMGSRVCGLSSYHPRAYLLNLGPLNWGQRVLPTGPSGKFPKAEFRRVQFGIKFWSVVGLSAKTEFSPCPPR